MFRKLLIFALSMFIASCGFATTYTTWLPISQTGQVAGDINEVGVYSYRINASSVAVMVNNTTKNNHNGLANPANQQGMIVYGVIFSSLTASGAGNYLILRDTTTPGISMTQAICPEIVVNQTVVSATNIVGVGQRYMFNPPIRCQYGLSACFLGGAENAAPTGSVSILYRYIGKEQ